MARAVSTDFIHSMRYHARVIPVGGGADPLVPAGRPEAGFSNMSTPEATVEAVEYKEGTMIYTQKYPGNPSMSDLTFSRGVARRDSTFWDWLRRVIEGSGEYRATVNVMHYHRDTALPRPFPATGELNATDINKDSPARTYIVYEAFPIRHKVAADMDATASEISVMELDISYEHFEVVEGAAPA
jgi:phage tail-like protein